MNTSNDIEYKDIFIAVIEKLLCFMQHMNIPILKINILFFRHRRVIYKYKKYNYKLFITVLIMTDDVSILCLWKKDQVFQGFSLLLTSYLETKIISWPTNNFSAKFWETINASDSIKFNVGMYAKVLDGSAFKEPNLIKTMHCFHYVGSKVATYHLLTGRQQPPKGTHLLYI